MRRATSIGIRTSGEEKLRALLPKLLDRNNLATRPPGDRQPDDAWIERMCHTIYASSREQAAEAVAEALAEGIAPEHVGEAISLAANQLVLHDPGRRQEDSPKKPVGSVHGASVGVHASDAANAWRNIARVSNRRNTYASLIVGAYHTAGQAAGLNPQPYPFAEHSEKVRSVAPTLCSTKPRPRSKRTTRRVPAPWCTATASSASRLGPPLTSCCATPSPRMGHCTPRSITAP